MCLKVVVVRLVIFDIVLWKGIFFTKLPILSLVKPTEIVLKYFNLSNVIFMCNSYTISLQASIFPQNMAESNSSALKVGLRCPDINFLSAPRVTQIQPNLVGKLRGPHNYFFSFVWVFLRRWQAFFYYALRDIIA